ncbi:MAG: hypothetical protein FWE88_07735 [Phycisphaerae bacterium]|nr:hypothetical protein [Phycisphaerae bacterium]
MSPLSAQAGNVRALHVVGEICYAAGDGGLVLRSDDAGVTWRPLRVGTQACFNAIVADALDADVLYVVGGQGVAGLPSRGGQGVVVKTGDGGKTFTPLAAGSLPCLYGGYVRGRSASFFGQGGGRSPSGLWRTGDGGDTFVPDSLESTGYLLAGRWRAPNSACLVGANDTLVEIRDVGGPILRNPAMPRPRALHAVGILDDGTIFAAGSGGSLIRSALGQKEALPVQLDLPPGSALLADFRTLCVTGDDIFIAGGLWGGLVHSADAGRRWQIRQGPRGGEVHALTAGDGFLLAGGSGGRIWRSDDNAASWKLVAGSAKTDVLFIMAGQDVAMLPMIVAHVLAGDEVAVVVATAPTDRFLPAGQNLVLALAATGAASVTVLDDFPSHCDPGDTDTPAADILQTWSDAIDVPAEPVLKRQLAAAIRLYQPAVLCVGPSGAGSAGFRGENRLIARMALEAADIAAMSPDNATTQPAAPPVGSAAAIAASLDRLHLPPWTCQRIWQGTDDNEFVPTPGDRQPTPNRKTCHAVLDAAIFWQGQSQSIEQLASRAAWIACPTFLPRPPRYTAYTSSEGRFRSLLTTGISNAYLQPRETSTLERDLSAAASVQFALATRGKATALAMLADDAKRAGTNADLVALAADRMLLVWQAMLANGRLIDAEQARREFLRVGAAHPLYDRVLAANVLVYFSREWHAQTRRFVADGKAIYREVNWPPETAAAVIKDTRELALWFDDPSLQLAVARAQFVSGKSLESKATIRAIADGPAEPVWKEYLAPDLAEPAARVAQSRVRRLAVPSAPAQAVTAPLQTPQGQQGEGDWADAHLQALRGQDNTLQLRVTLPHRRDRSWDIELAFDSDRDTQILAVLRADTAGQKSFRLEGPLIPPVELETKTIVVQLRRDDDVCTFEIALPLTELGIVPTAPAMCGFTLRATARDPGKKTTDRPTVTTFLFQPDTTTTLRGERLGLLVLEPVRK